MLENPPFFLLVHFQWFHKHVNKSDSSRDASILMMSSIYSFGIIEAGAPEPWIFFLIAASVADVAAVYLNGIKTLLANYLNTFFINGNLVFSNDPRSLPGNVLIVLFYPVEFLIILY